LKRLTVLEFADIAAHEQSDLDIQWSRIVMLELVPHPAQVRPAARYRRQRLLSIESKKYHTVGRNFGYTAAPFLAFIRIHHETNLRIVETA
jgi:hypothetical protein